MTAANMYFQLCQTQWEYERQEMKAGLVEQYTHKNKGHLKHICQMETMVFVQSIVQEILCLLFAVQFLPLLVSERIRKLEWNLLLCLYPEPDCEQRLYGPSSQCVGEGAEL